MTKSLIAAYTGEQQQQQLPYAAGTKTLILFFIVTYQTLSTVNSKSVVAKCCPPGQVFSVSENFTCAYSTNSTRELYPLTRALHENFSCNVTGNLTITALDDIVESVIHAPFACLDFLYDGENIPVILQCTPKNQQNNNNHYYNNESLPVPRLSNIRICCNPGFIYDVKSKACVKRIYELNVPEYFRFFNDSLEFLTVYRGTPMCQYAIVDYTVNVTEYLPRLLNDGNLEIVVSAKNGSFAIVANEKNSCVDPGDESTDLMALRLCSGMTYCKENECVRKCCPEGEAYFLKDCRKIPANASAMNFHNALLDTSRERGLAESVNFLNTSDYGLLIGKPCKNRARFFITPEDDWHMNPRGHIFVPHYESYDSHEYCADIVYMGSESDGAFLPSVCFKSPAAPREDSLIRFNINGVLELVSSGFLIVTLLVYICLPSLRNLHGKTLMCHVSSLIVAYLSTASMALHLLDHPSSKTTAESTSCKYLGYTGLLSWIAAFSWLNVMCFDIWWTFGGLGRAAVSGGRGKAYKKRFFMYSLYAWGLPLLITSLGVAADVTKSLPLRFRPNIGVSGCWFESGAYYYGNMIFFIVPLTLQLITNVVFFTLTSIHCSRVKAEITRVMSTPTDSRNRRFRADRTKLIMNLKLFIVMGVTWTMEVISTLVNQYAINFSWRDELFYLSDVINCLQGVLIFMLFVLKKKVYYALRRRLGPRTGNLTANKSGQSLQDPHRVRKSVSSSTIMSNFAISASPT